MNKNIKKMFNDWCVDASIENSQSFLKEFLLINIKKRFDQVDGGFINIYLNDYKQWLLVGDKSQYYIYNNFSFIDDKRLLIDQDVDFIFGVLTKIDFLLSRQKKQFKNKKYHLKIADLLSKFPIEKAKLEAAIEKDLLADNLRAVKKKNKTNRI